MPGGGRNNPDLGIDEILEGWDEWNDIGQPGA